MKKAVAALVLVLSMSAVCFGEEAKDSSVYLRQDVFDAKMDSFMKEIRGEFQVMSKELRSEMQLTNQETRGEFQSTNQEVRGEFQLMNAKIDTLSKRVDDNYRSLDTRITDLRNGLYLRMVLFGLVISLPIVQKFLQDREERKEADSKTAILEEVKRLISENNAELMRTLRA